MIVHAQGDHIHSRRPAGGYDRCHGRPPCDPQIIGLDGILELGRATSRAVDDTPFDAEYVRKVAAQMRDDHGRRDWAELERQQQEWLNAEIERVLTGRMFGKTRALLETQGLYLQWGESTIPLPPDED